MTKRWVFSGVLATLALVSSACSPSAEPPTVAPPTDASSSAEDAAFPLGGPQGAASRPLTGDYLGQDPPGITPEIFAPGIISHGFHEHHLTISPDGDEMFYATSSSDHQVYVIAHVWRENGVWHGPEIAPFSGHYTDMGPAFSPDGQALYFTSRRPSTGAVETDGAETDDEETEGREENSTFDIWVTRRAGDAGETGEVGEVREAGGAWSEPENLGAPVNTEWNEIFPSIASSGTLYFQRYEESGSESDFYISRLVDGEYQTPVKLEYGISTEHYESHPAVAPDESHLIFQSIRLGGFGGVDFYVSFRSEDGTWSEPENLGETVSASDNVISPMLSPDGRYFFFARNGPAEPASFPAGSYYELIRRFRGPENGYGCLYWVDASVVYDVHPALRQ